MLILQILSSCKTNLVTALGAQYFRRRAAIHRDLKKPCTPPDRKQRLVITFAIELSKLTNRPSINNKTFLSPHNVRHTIPETIDVNDPKWRLKRRQSNWIVYLHPEIPRRNPIRQRCRHRREDIATMKRRTWLWSKVTIGSHVNYAV